MSHPDQADSEMTVHALAQAIERHVRVPGDEPSILPGLSFHRRNTPNAPIDCIYGLSLGVSTQGAKQVMYGERIYDYGPGEAMLTTIDQPVVSRITRATTREPYLGMLLKLDARAITLAAAEMKLPPLGPDRGEDAICIGRLDSATLDALRRLVEVLDHPLLVPQLAPLIQQEIAVRLLVGPHGHLLRKLAALETPSEQVSRVVAWLKQNFARPIRIDDLAGKANMSPSTFRQHFRAVTGMSPLQYQKQLRLQEARQLMMNRNIDAGRASSLVGYESASQFSREYSRLFGAPPQRDVQRMRVN